MKFILNGYSAEPMGQGVAAAIKTALMAPAAREAAEGKAALQGAQMYHANMAGNKAGTEAEAARFTLGQRQGVDDYLAQNPQLAPYARAMMQVFKLTGDTNAERVAHAGTEFQTQGIRDRAVDAVGDVDMMNRLNTLAKPGATYTPYDNVGNTGHTINKATGAQTAENSTLAKLFGAESQSRTAENEAQADNARASASATRAKMEAKTPTVIGYDQQGNPITDAPDPKLTEMQGKATLFASRMQDSSTILNELEGKVSPVQTALSGTAAGNIIATPDAQRYRQAQENWVTANLRQESGAAIPPKEMDQEIKKWFPRIGDGPDVIHQKAAARKVAEEGMLTLAGPGGPMVNRNLVRAGSAAAKAPAGAAAQASTSSAPAARRVVRSGTYNGRRVVQYDDGSTEYQ